MVLVSWYTQSTAVRLTHQSQRQKIEKRQTKSWPGACLIGASHWSVGNITVNLLPWTVHGRLFRFRHWSFLSWYHEAYFSSLLFSFLFLFSFPSLPPVNWVRGLSLLALSRALAGHRLARWKTAGIKSSPLWLGPCPLWGGGGDGEGHQRAARPRTKPNVS